MYLYYVISIVTLSKFWSNKTDFSKIRCATFHLFSIGILWLFWATARKMTYSFLYMSISLVGAFPITCMVTLYPVTTFTWSVCCIEFSCLLCFYTALVHLSIHETYSCKFSMHYHVICNIAISNSFLLLSCPWFHVYRPCIHNSWFSVTIESWCFLCRSWSNFGGEARIQE